MLKYTISSRRPLPFRLRGICHHLPGTRAVVEPQRRIALRRRVRHSGDLIGEILRERCAADERSEELRARRAVAELVRHAPSLRALRDALRCPVRSPSDACRRAYRATAGLPAAIDVEIRRKIGRLNRIVHEVVARKLREPGIAVRAGEHRGPGQRAAQPVIQALEVEPDVAVVQLPGDVAPSPDSRNWP